MIYITRIYKEFQDQSLSLIDMDLIGGQVGTLKQYVDNKHDSFARFNQKGTSTITVKNRNVATTDKLGYTTFTYTTYTLTALIRPFRDYESDKNESVSNTEDGVKFKERYTVLISKNKLGSNTLNKKSIFTIGSDDFYIETFNELSHEYMLNISKVNL